MTLKNLIQLRQTLYATIRAFFAARDVLEVETPLLSEYTVTDPHIESFAVPFGDKNYFLQTSPEYAMKRLLADGSGSIFQITKAFRKEESGSKHHPEFSMLEWYRIGFDHHDLMNELDVLLQLILKTKPAQKISYRDLFLKNIDVDPFAVSHVTLKKIIVAKNIRVDCSDADFDFLLNILLTHCIEPTLGFEAPIFVYDFPVTQAALAKIRQEDPPVAERFELYIRGMEIANGFHELCDAKEQEKRFQENQRLRKNKNQFIPEIDHHFIDALKKGLPDCAGVAMGLDRLLLLQLKAVDIREVIVF
ncbi:MAG: EF-P lysine aminoacylase GenX [Gammaproteobacteria bacterium RIFCSPHIGHO2_01_FULL_42_8]|nr:MAG: EF-P lysine aminoacylase GenX [Gammaproteobacteria bacterium RIFCSPHIGHO2_01_FULL_42_8]